MTVVTREQIEQRGADNVLQALLGESGITLQGRTIGGRRGLSLRGMDGRHVLTLVNGKRISASDGVIGHSDFQYDWIPIEGIERIEVIRGPMSVLYGSEALGGVINVILRQPGDAWAGSALVEGRQATDARGGDGQRVAVRVAGPLGEQWRLGVTLSDVRLESVDSEADALHQRDRGPREARCAGAAGLAAGRGAGGGGGILGSAGRSAGPRRASGAGASATTRRRPTSIVAMPRSAGPRAGAAPLEAEQPAARVRKFARDGQHAHQRRGRAAAEQAGRPRHRRPGHAGGHAPAIGHRRLRAARRAAGQRGPARRLGRCAAPGAVPAGRDRARPGTGADARPALRPAGHVRRRMEPTHLRRVAAGAAVDGEGWLWPRLQGADAEADLARLPRGRGAVHLPRQSPTYSPRRTTRSSSASAGPARRPRRC